MKSLPMQANDDFPYWALAFIVGTSLTLMMFSALPLLGQHKVPLPTPVMVVDFMQWREPIKIPKQNKPLVKPKPKPPVKPKPLPKQQIKPKTLPQKPKKPKTKPVISTAKPPQTPPAPTPPETIIEREVKPIPAMPIPEEAATKEDKALPKPMPLFKLTALPRFAHRAEPVYPADMRLQGKEGSVKLEVLIDKEGKVRNITVAQSAGDAFDQAAIDAIQASSFLPGNVEGKSVPVLLRLPIRFKLK